MNTTLENIQDDLVAAGVIASPVALELVKSADEDVLGGIMQQDAGRLNAIDQGPDRVVGANNTVPVNLEGSVDIEFTGENTGNATNDIYVGLAFRTPNNNIRNLDIISAGNINPGDSFTVRKNSVNTSSDGNTIFSEIGQYNLIATIWDVSNPSGNTDKLSDKIEIENAVEVSEEKSATINTIRIDGTQVF